MFAQLLRVTNTYLHNERAFLGNISFMEWALPSSVAVAMSYDDFSGTSCCDSSCVDSISKEQFAFWRREYGSLKGRPKVILRRRIVAFRGESGRICYCSVRRVLGVSHQTIRADRKALDLVGNVPEMTAVHGLVGVSPANALDDDLVQQIWGLLEDEIEPCFARKDDPIPVYLWTRPDCNGKKAFARFCIQEKKVNFASLSCHQRWLCCCLSLGLQFSVSAPFFSSHIISSISCNSQIKR